MPIVIRDCGVDDGHACGKLFYQWRQNDHQIGAIEDRQLPIFLKLTRQEFPVEAWFAETRGVEKKNG